MWVCFTKSKYLNSYKTLSFIIKHNEWLYGTGINKVK